MGVKRIVTNFTIRHKMIILDGFSFEEVKDKWTKEFFD
tara:strand:+ start:186 stop:299 length:114 start_codon:yes stop_codon:yes gene_type:complete